MMPQRGLELGFFSFSILLMKPEHFHQLRGLNS